MRRIIKTTLIAMAAVLLFAVVVRLTYIGDGKITPGTYEIKDFDPYPDAYIEVGEDTIQFHNIDLNAIYQEKQLEQYNKLVENYPDAAMSDEDVKKYSDLNACMAENPYPIDYVMNEDAKTGTFTYEFNFYTKLPFGFGISYDSLQKTLHIDHYVQALTFKK